MTSFRISAIIEICVAPTHSSSPAPPTASRRSALSRACRFSACSFLPPLPQRDEPRSVQGLGKDLRESKRLRHIQCVLDALPCPLGFAGEVQEELGIPASTLSHHLEKLKQVGLVNVRRQGTFLWYSADTDALREVLSFLYEECCMRSRSAPVESVVQISRGTSS